MEMMEKIKKIEELMERLPEKERQSLTKEIDEIKGKLLVRETRRTILELIRELKAELRGEKRSASERRVKVNFLQVERAIALLTKEGDKLVKQGIIAIAPIFKHPPKLVVLGVNEKLEMVAMGEVVKFKIPLEIELYPSDKCFKWKVQFDQNRNPKIILLSQALSWIDEVTKDKQSPQAAFLRRLFELPVISPSLKEEDVTKLLLLRTKEEQKQQEGGKPSS